MGKKIRAIFRLLVIQSADADPHIDLYADDEIAQEMANFPSHADALAAGYEFKEDFVEFRKGSQGAERSPEREDEDDDDDADEEDENLNEILTFYDADYLLPFVERILWLSTVKEALGHVPFKLSHDEIVAMVILQTEINKKSQYDINKSKIQSGSGSGQPTSSASSPTLASTPRLPASRASRSLRRLR